MLSFSVNVDVLERRQDTVVPHLLSFALASRNGSVAISLMADQTLSALRVAVAVALAESETMLSLSVDVDVLEVVLRGGSNGSDGGSNSVFDEHCQV